MRKYVGVYVVTATPMNRGKYGKLRGWGAPSDEWADDEGYLVEHTGGTKNHSDYDGYVTWYPKEIFEKKYKDIDDGMNFSEALLLLKQGKKVARKGWNGKNMFIFLVDGSKFIVNREPLLSILGEGTQVNYRPHIDMKTAGGEIVPWVASQTDMLANDWTAVE